MVDPCWNVFQSIPGAAFFTLLNLFGEFPLIDQHSVAGKFVGTLVAVVAVAVFAIPAGILGNGFEDLLARRREQKEKIVRRAEAKRRLQQAARAMQAATTLGWNEHTASISSSKEELVMNIIQEEEDREEVERRSTMEVLGDPSSWTGATYNFLYAHTPAGLMFEHFIMFLIFATTITFMLETTSWIEHNTTVVTAIEVFELFAVVIFSLEYLFRVITTVAISKKYQDMGVFRGTMAHCCTFFAVVDLLSVVPYWVDFFVTIGMHESPFLSTSASSTFIRCLRLLRVLKAEKYTNAFSVFDDVLAANSEVLVVTGFCALVMWIFFSAFMYFAERQNADPEMRSYYNSVPNAMWMTLLNLSGEAPLCHYTLVGKILVGIIGVFATGFFGIPIGLLGAGFEEYIQDNEEDNEDELFVGENEKSPLLASNSPSLRTSISIDQMNVDGLELNPRHNTAVGTLSSRRQPPTESDKREESTAMELAGRFLDPSADIDDNKAQASTSFGRLEVAFDIIIFSLIFLTVTMGCLQTIDSLNCDDSTNVTVTCSIFTALEWFAIIVFTCEYMARLVVAPYTPEVLKCAADTTLTSSSPTSTSCAAQWPRLSFIFSFYSLIDLLAILPFYLAEAAPGGWVDQNDEYFRMLRLIRLLKLDKYIPSITLIDDVFRLKKNALLVTGFVSGALWILFSALQYLTEYQDTENAVDPLPDYGCDTNCSMSNRFSSVVSTLTYTCVHLTGDYPIVSYSFWGRVVCFFMVLTAVGVVSIPSGLIASGFAQVVQSKSTLRNKSKTKGAEEKEIERRERLHSLSVGDGYFERKYAELDGVEPLSCGCGDKIDHLQSDINTFLNGRMVMTNASTQTTVVQRSRISAGFNYLILFLIVTNIIAVVVETVPEVDRFVGNQTGNFFDVFELISVTIFALEYCLRMFSVVKDREHLYSPYFYATTFFGIVDLVAFAPYFVEQLLIQTHVIVAGGDAATIFRLFRIFRILQLEHFVVAFTVLDNVFRASKDVLKATGLMALIIWVGCGAVFFIAEQNNPNWRQCTDQVPLTTKDSNGCYDFPSTAACNEKWPNQCTQVGFVNMPDSLYYTAVFLGGEWGKIDFTVVGRLNCIFLCIAGIAIYAIPVGTLFDSFGAVLGMTGGDDEDDEDDEVQ